MGSSFQVSKVSKQGYELFDRKIIGKRYDFNSKEDVEIVLVDTKQQQKERRQLEKKAEERALASYRAKCDKLAKQYEQEKAITTEQYRLQLEELQNALDKYTNNIGKTVDYYLHIDYLGMDENDAEIARCMENAEYERADSLIRLVFDPGSVVSLSQAAARQLDDEEATLLAKLEEVRAKKDKKASQDVKNAEYLYYLYTIALSNFNNDSAHFYITQRAALDTTCVQWQDDAGHFLMDYLQQFKEAEKYFTRSMNIHKAQGEEGERGLIDDLDNLGLVYYQGSHYHDFIPREKAIPFVEQALSISQRILGEDDPLTAEQYNNLGLLTQNTSLIYKAIEILESLPGEKHPYLATYYENMATMRLIPNRYWRQAMEHYLLPALAIKEKAYGKESLETAGAYLRIGGLYRRQSHYMMSKWWHDCSLALAYFENALPIFERTYGQQHLQVAEIHLQMGEVLADLGEHHDNSGNVALADGYLAIAQEHLTKAQSIYQAYKDKFGIEPTQLVMVEDLLEEAINRQAELGDNVHNPNNVAFSYKDLAALNYSHSNYERALTYYGHVMDVEHISSNPMTYEHALECLDIGKIYYTMGDSTNAQLWFDKVFSTKYQMTANESLSKLYDSQGESRKAVECYQKYIETEQADGNIWPEHYEHMATLYEHGGDFAHSIECWQRALAMRDSIVNAPPTLASTLWDNISDTINEDEEEEKFHIPTQYDYLLECYNRLGHAYVMKGDKSNAEKCFMKVLSLQIDSLGPQHHQVAVCYDSLGMMHCQLGEFEQSKLMLDKAKKIREKAEFDNEGAHELALADGEICLGKLYAAQNDSTHALQCFRHAYATRADHTGHQSYALTECWLCVAKVCEDFGRYDDALACYDSALSCIQHSSYDEWSTWYRSAINPPDYEVFSIIQRIKQLEAKLTPMIDE